MIAASAARASAPFHKGPHLPVPPLAFDALLGRLARAGEIQPVCLAMAEAAVTPPWGTKGNINRAGEALRNRALTPDDVRVLEVWRHAHKYVLNTFQALLRNRTRGTNIEVAQRLKRRTTITDKLFREPKMQLARMDDVAGCRIIFPDIKSLYDFRASLHAANFDHVTRNEPDKYDYIKSPKPLGYRGIHDIYGYNVRSEKGAAYHGLMIELQYRTLAQHAWATSVEMITQITEHEPKFNRGDPAYMDHFKLASEIIARAHENNKGIYPDLSDSELIERYRKNEDSTHVLGILRGLDAMNAASESASAENVILHMTEDRQLTFKEFEKDDEASQALFDLERNNPTDDVVLVGASTFKEVRSAFRNYFSDAREFLRLVDEGTKSLGARK